MYTELEFRGYKQSGRGYHGDDVPRLYRIIASSGFDAARSWNVVTLGCGHTFDGNPTMTFRVGDTVPCRQCGEQLKVALLAEV